VHEGEGGGLHPVFACAFRSGAAGSQAGADRTAEAAALRNRRARSSTIAYDRGTREVRAASVKKIWRKYRFVCAFENIFLDNAPQYSFFFGTSLQSLLTTI